MALANGNEWRPRITIDLSEDLYKRAQAAFPWGTRNNILLAMITQVVEAIEKEGPVVGYLIMNGKLRLFGGTQDEVATRVLGKGEQNNVSES